MEASLGNILILDDEVKLRELLSRMIGLEGYQVSQAGTVKEALRKLGQEGIHVLLTDVRLPDGNGVDLVQEVRAQYPETEVVVMTAFGTISDGVKAMRHGALDYLVKGDDNSKVIPLLARAMEKVHLRQKVSALEKKLYHQQSFESIRGKSPALALCIELGRKVAATDTTVLLTGETGTGKEVFAQAIHTASSRGARPLVAVNCSALSGELLESELFGYKAGAFTGAAKDKKGLLEEAHQGTLFLDEIGEMPLAMQAKLLRVLETGIFLRVGDTKEHKVNVRLIAATNRNLQEECEKGHFRLDLFYRLSVFQIALPTLQERQTDIEDLAAHFAGHFAGKSRKLVPSLAPSFIRALKAHTWKGNIRELKNVIERAVILCEDGELLPEHLPFDFFVADPAHATDAYSLAEVEKAHIRKMLAVTKGNKTETAKLLQIGLTTLYRKIEEYGL